jgi:hypothetical protein
MGAREEPDHRGRHPSEAPRQAQRSRREVEQCFENKCGTFLPDTREDHQTDPPTLWFIAPTNPGRLLKVIFVFRDGNIYVKSAYEPEPAAITIYERKGK